MWITALNSGQGAPMFATRRAQSSQNLERVASRPKAKPSIGADKLHSIMVVALQQLALLDPTQHRTSK